MGLRFGGKTSRGKILASEGKQLHLVNTSLESWVKPVTKLHTYLFQWELLKTATFTFGIGLKHSAKGSFYVK